jgi:hypothetical protein
LTDRDLDRFPDQSLLHQVARAVCHAGCLPRKELFETWEVARRVRRRVRGGRVLDLGGGHGLLAHIMLLLDASSPGAVVVDRNPPASAPKLHAALVSAWPKLAGRVEGLHAGMDEVDIGPADVVVSSHACGALTDVVLRRAVGARVPVAVLPCCHDASVCDTGGLSGWMDTAAAIDAVRAMRLSGAGYRVWTQRIPEEITPRNRLLIGMPIGHEQAAGTVERTGLRSAPPSSDFRLLALWPTCQGRDVVERRGRDGRPPPAPNAGRAERPDPGPNPCPPRLFWW